MTLYLYYIHMLIIYIWALCICKKYKKNSKMTIIDTICVISFIEHSSPIK